MGDKETADLSAGEGIDNIHLGRGRIDVHRLPTIALLKLGQGIGERVGVDRRWRRRWNPPGTPGSARWSVE